MTCVEFSATGGRAAPASRPTPRRIAATLACWHRRAAERRQLAEMPRERWSDIARDPDAIRREIAKPFWRP